MATNIIASTNIDSGWLSYSLGANRGLYLIGIKNPKTETDAFDINDLKYLIMEIGIDSGISNKPITIQRVKLDFSEETSSDKELNKITALTKVTQLPNSIYLRVVSFNSINGDQYTKGSMPVGINITPFNN